ncbi:MAG: efflux RND transporter periplasmic adaptor subunit [Verrucomicrobiales bacterium]|nr:efflux RND transporter periplasmic adaptor subunit [Verrucomicrobiales bacterium]
MRSVILGLLVLAVAGGGYALWHSRRASSDAATQAEAGQQRPTTATVERGAVNFAVGVAGEIGPAEQVSVRPEVNGRISELPVDVGDRVAKGSLLFALDDRDLKLEVETRMKQIENAKLQLDKARIATEQAGRDYERDKELFEAKLLAEQAYEASRQRHESSVKDQQIALNAIERSEKDLALAEERLSRARIVAPFDCTVLTRPVSIGQAVSGSGGFNSGTEVLTIADLSAMVINAHVNQADVTRLKSGMHVNVEVDAVPGLQIEGEVERIAPQATLRNNIKGYATRIVLKNVDPRVQPGMTASISIPVSAADDVLTVPLTSVFSEQGERYVYLKQGDSFVRRDVLVGVSDLFKAEIKSGLAEGDVVSLEQPAGLPPRTPSTSAMAHSQPGTASGSATAATTKSPAASAASKPSAAASPAAAASSTTTTAGAPKSTPRPGT